MAQEGKGKSRIFLAPRIRAKDPQLPGFSYTPPHRALFGPLLEVYENCKVQEQGIYDVTASCHKEIVNVIKVMYVHFHSLDSLQLSGAAWCAPKLEGAFLLLSGCRILWFPPPWAEFPAPGSRLALRFEARQLVAWQGRRGRD